MINDHYEGYRHGKSDAYALAALIVRKVNDIEDAAELLQALAKVADEKNGSPMEQNTGKAKDAV